MAPACAKSVLLIYLVARSAPPFQFALDATLDSTSVEFRVFPVSAACQGASHASTLHFASPARADTSMTLPTLFSADCAPPT